MCPCEAAHGQHFGRGVCKSSRGDSLPSFVQPGSGSVGMGTQSGFLSQCRAPIAADWQSRHFQDSSNWKLCPEVFHALMLIRGPCTKDLFADWLNAQLPQFFSWRPDPLALASDALQQDRSNERNYAFPPFCLIMRSLAKLREQGGELVLVTPVWPTQVWYPTLLDLSVSLPVLLPASQNLLLGPQGQVHPLIANQTLFLTAWHVSNNPCNRKAFVQTLPSSSWQLGGLVQTRFITAPGRNGIAGVSRESDSFCPTLADITSFLSDCFNQGLEYRILNTYRSALSGVLPPIDGFPVGQHPLVVRLLKGVQNLRPALPRYQYSWDVDKVLNYSRSLRKNEDLPLKSLTQKLAVLLALTAPKRASELRLLDLRFMRILPEGVEFKLPGLTKTSCEVTSVFFAKYTDCADLCVLRCLQCYITRTSPFRPVLDSDTSSQLLVTYHRPHRPVQSCSISRWINSVLSSLELILRALTQAYLKGIRRCHLQLGLRNTPRAPDNHEIHAIFSVLFDVSSYIFTKQS